MPRGRAAKDNAEHARARRRAGRDGECISKLSSKRSQSLCAGEQRREYFPFCARRRVEWASVRFKNARTTLRPQPACQSDILGTA
eukprot:13972071-Alexandrium_andersonii.AAC.1